MMKYSKWIGMVGCLALVVVCFMPWTYHADLHKSFTGFFSEKNAYGKPGKFIILFCVVSFFLIMAQKVWAQRVLLFVSGTLLAYSVKTYILYTSCYNAYCPDKKAGIYLLIALSVLIFCSALFSDVKVSPGEIKKSVEKEKE
jgi:hypothetical protein